jgi:hypothetical protein
VTSSASVTLDCKTDLTALLVLGSIRLLGVVISDSQDRGPAAVGFQLGSGLSDLRRGEECRVRCRRPIANGQAHG